MMSTHSVLVIDDDKAIGAMIAALLAKIDVSTEVFDSAQMGLQRLNEIRFPVVITDLRMPNMGGEELIQYIKRTDPFVQVFVITADARTDRIGNCFAIGASDVFLKTENLSSLVGSVAEAISRSERWNDHFLSHELTDSV